MIIFLENMSNDATSNDLPKYLQASFTRLPQVSLT